MSQPIDKIRGGTIYDEQNKNKKTFVRREQEAENRRFDTIATSHGEKISTLEKRIDDMEPRLRRIESFKYILVGLGVALGFFMQLLYLIYKSM